MQLKLKSCDVRSWRTADAEPLARHADNRKIWLNLRDAFPHPYTHHDAREFIRSIRNRTPETTFAIAVNDEAVGSVGFVLRPDVERVSAEIGYWLAEPFWGRGIATDALVALTELCDRDARADARLRAAVRVERGVVPSAGKSRLPAGGAAAPQRDQERRRHRSAAVRLHRAGHLGAHRGRSAATRNPRLKPLSCGACV